MTEEKTIDTNELINFIEMIEAFTKDKNTAASIRLFMENKGFWEPTNVYTNQPPTTWI